MAIDWLTMPLSVVRECGNLPRDGVICTSITSARQQRHRMQLHAAPPLRRHDRAAEYARQPQPASAGAGAASSSPSADVDDSIAAAVHSVPAKSDTELAADAIAAAKPDADAAERQRLLVGPLEFE